jgi:eukaryotic-like serine/threonine-protein kinase
MPPAGPHRSYPTRILSGKPVLVDNVARMQVGTRVGGRYSIEAVAGSGGMCSVYRARDDDGATVAIKALHQRAVEAEERFAREVQVLQELRHPAIVRYLDSGLDETGERFLVMEWLDGADLDAVLRTRILSIGEVLALVGRIAHALSAAHIRGIVHRDVKPSNIFICGDDVRSAKLLDFGVARWRRGARPTLTGTSLGTPAYMAPEQVRGERIIDARADVFALGCVMYECLTGEPAFVAHNPMAVFCKILVDRPPSAAEAVGGLPEPIDQLLQAMLAKDPAGRPRDAAAVAHAVESLLATLDSSIGVHPPIRTPAPLREKKMITGDEQRLVNVIVAGSAAASSSAGEALTVNLAPARVPAVAFSQRVNVRFDALGDGSLVALLEASGVATDQAMNAARFALALRDEFPGGQLVLATGLAMLGKTKLVGEAIERACQLLAADLAISSDRSTARPIRLDPVTASFLGNRFDLLWDDRGPMLVGSRQAALDPGRMLLGKPTPFVGRTRELGMLTSTLEESIELGVARAVLVTGQAGSGKSRLLRELLTQLDARRDIEVWRAHGDPMRAGSALDLMAEAVRRLTGIVDDEPGPIRRKKLDDTLAKSIPEAQRERVGDFLGELLRLPRGRDESPALHAARLDPMLMSDQVRRALEDLLDAYTRARPLVLVLEDLHWGDQASIALVDRALRILAERRFMVVALARPELREHAPRLWSGHNMTEILLGPLPRRAAYVLADAVLGPDAPSERVAELVERADGNPFYLEELLRTASAGDWVLPETVLAMMQARIESLEPEARRVLRAASVFGATFWREGVATLLGGGDDLDRWIESLVDRELIAPTEDTRFSSERAYRFRHEILREASYSLLVAEDRRLGHRLAAEWMERAGATDPLALAQHFERGGAVDRALPHYVAATERALERGDFAAILETVRHAEACGPDASTRGRLAALSGDAHYWRGEHAEAERRYVEALELLLPGTRQAHHVAAYLMIVWGAFEAREKMEALGRRLLDTAHLNADPESRCGALATAGSRLFLAGSLSLAHELLAASTQMMARLSVVEAAVAAQVHRCRAASALVEAGDPSTFLEEMEAGARRYEQIGDAREVCFQRANIGYAYASLGLYEDAERELRASLATAEQMALDHVAAGARSNLGIVLGYLGRGREGVSQEQRAVAFFAQRGDRRLTGASKLYLALLYLLDGNPALAESEARDALGHLGWGTQAQALSTLARSLLALGRVDEAVAEARRAHGQIETSAVYEGEASVCLVLAEALDAQGKRDEARTVLASARQRLLARAQRITRPDWRQSFLERVPDHARTLQLAREWAA